MTLPPEIRLMVYDSLMPITVRFDGWGDYPGLQPAIRALMRVKAIRAELLPHIFTRYHYNWIYSFKRPHVHSGWYRFKRRAIPFLKRFTFEISRSYKRPHAPTELFYTLLNWMRWRSLRSHLHPWHLKKLTLSVFPYRFDKYANPQDLPSTESNDEFLEDAPVVPGLESLTIVLNGRVGEEAAKEFLERCASCGVQGKIGYWYYDYDRGKTLNLAYVLQEGQIVCADD